jgi:hypothetical protein
LEKDSVVHTRKTLTKEEINEILTAEIQQNEDLEDAVLRLSYVLREPDSSGCNWSSDHYLNVGKNGSQSHAAPIARKIIEATRAKYNVKI